MSSQYSKLREDPELKIGFASVKRLDGIMTFN